MIYLGHYINAIAQKLHRGQLKLTPLLIFVIAVPSRTRQVKYPKTPDGRYFIHNERLWRCTNPSLGESERSQLVKELMAARRAVNAAKIANDRDKLGDARARVHAAKVSLGERGPTWWDDDVDHNRKLVKNSPYARWWQTSKEK